MNDQSPYVPRSEYERILGGRSAAFSEIARLENDLHRARLEVVRERHRHLETIRGLLMLAAFAVPVWNEWPWYIDVSVFSAIYIVGDWTCRNLFNLRDNQLSFPDEPVPFSERICRIENPEFYSQKYDR